jgi:hypothetical protein
MRQGRPRGSLVAVVASLALLVGCSVGVVEDCDCGDPRCARPVCAQDDGAVSDTVDATDEQDTSPADVLPRTDVTDDRPIAHDAAAMDAPAMDASTMDASAMDAPAMDVPVVDVVTLDAPVADTPVRDTSVPEAAVPDVPPPDSGPAAPPVLSLLGNNDLDFWYVPTITNTDASQTLRLTAVVSGVGRFFANGGNHVVLALNPEGGAGGNDPHCGPIVRRGANLFTNARGFIFFAGDNDVRAEHWNGTASPGLAQVPNGTSAVFRPAQEDTLHIRITVGYRTGVLANTMRIEIRRGDNLGGDLLFSGIQPGWGWDWRGTHRACIGMIAGGFRSPNDTGCVETRVSRSAPAAELTVVSAQLQTY